MQIISFTLNNPLQIPLKESTPRFMLIIPMTCCCLTSLIHSSKLDKLFEKMGQMTIIASYT